MCRTLVLEGFCFFSAKRALRAASQSKTEWTGRALKGDRAVVALKGESRLETLGLGGSFKLGKVARPVGGADMGGVEQVKGLGGTMGAVAGGEGPSEALELTLEADDDDDRRSRLVEMSVSSLVAVSGRESGVVSPEAITVEVGVEVAGELRANALVRKSV